MTLKEIRERQNQLVSEARQILDQIKPDMPEARAKELEAQYDAAMAEHDRLDERAAQMQRVIDAEARASAREQEVDIAKRPAGADVKSTAAVDGPTDEERAALRDAAFRSYLIGGVEGMTPEHRTVMREMRAQATTPNEAGGYTVPPGFLATLIETMRAYSPMFDPGVTAQLVTDRGNNLIVPGINDVDNEAVQISENAAATEQDIVTNDRQLDAYKFSSRIVRISMELLQDSAFDIEAVVAKHMGVRFARGAGKALTIGTGVDQPHGIVTAAPLGATAGTVDAISFLDLIELQHSIDPAYRAGNACFMFNDMILRDLRKIRDADGNFIWQPASVQTGAPATLLGDVYKINQAMTSTIAAGSRTVIYGDMQMYTVRRVRNHAVKRLVERYAEFDQYGYLGFGRFDGEIMDTNAIKHLVHTA